MDVRRYNQLPNKRLKIMSKDESQKGKADGSVFSNFAQAEQNFQAQQSEEWKMPKGRNNRQNRPKDKIKTNHKFDRDRSRGNECYEARKQDRPSARPSQNPNKLLSQNCDVQNYDKQPLQCNNNKRQLNKPNEEGKKHKRSDNSEEKSCRSSDRHESNKAQKRCNKVDEESFRSSDTNSANPVKYDINFSDRISYTKLQQISGKDSTDIIRILANSGSGLDEFLSGTIKPDCMYLIVKILRKLTASDWEENKEHVLMRTATPEFLKKLAEFVTFLVTDEQSGRRRDEMEQFFENLLVFFHAILTVLPTVAAEHLLRPLRATKMAMTGVTEYQNVSINTNLHDKIKQLLVDVEERKKEKEERERVMKEEKEVYYPRSLGSIRDVPLYPRPEDIARMDGKIVPNKIKGPYNNVEHYLDVQFRLLREDFIAPVRQGINDYRIGQDNKSKKKRTLNNIRIYQRVKFLKPKVIVDKVGYDICFDPDKRIRTKWEHTKRFIFGSLLIFTTDNFHTFFLATVVKRDLAIVEKDRIISVILCDTKLQSEDILSKEYVMAESEVYFEPYYNVLKALQKFNNVTFPMKNYLVYVETKTNRPTYTRNGSDVYTISAGNNGRKTIKLFESHSWPAPHELGFDDAQMSAFKAALTNDLVVIQGPPGTGKTYLGLKIAGALLENSVIWNSDHKTPILVICYTNHALDQFLEGILQRGLTDNLVRIGGRSKSEALEPFNLRERRTSVAYFCPNYYQAALLKDLKQKMSEIFENIKSLQDNLESLDKNDGILSLNTLTLAISENHLRFFKNNDHFLEWLLLGVSHKMNSRKKLISSVDKEIKRNRTKNDVEDFGFDSSDFENVLRLKEVLFDSIDLEESDRPNNSKLSIYFACTLDEIQKKIEEYSKAIESLPGSDNSRENIQKKMKEAKNAQCDLKFILEYLNEELKKTDIPTEEETNRLSSITDLNSLSCGERWVLYKIWIEFMKAGYWMMIGKLEEMYRTGSRRFDEARQFDDLRIVQQADVVGITTTTAARLQAMLRELRPKIVIVEEAAEVLEAHIVASLSVYCQHLILIGDHKQLRPSPADYKLAKDCHLDVSLFERLINNGINYHTLTTQHRMRPEISRLLVPTIYPTLYDHESTVSRAHIRGMDNNVFFMNHNHFEDEVDDIASKKNQFEARMVMQLARHLLLQGYRPDEITVLATYRGQMYLLKDEQRRLEISDDLLVTVVDNFQGEENKIILLSLVRSNAEHKIGFLKTDNRVCVALSRARDGLFVFGNMDCLAAESPLWQKIQKCFIEQNSFGPALVLRCETHRQEYTRIVNPTDFNQVLEGGCSKPCGEELPCKHRCKSLCHVSKDRHTRYPCSEPCNRFMCLDNHPCPKKCYQPCDNCIIPMKRTLDCGHEIVLPCCAEYSKMDCKQMVTLHFPGCDHEVQVECFRKKYKQCPKPCEFRLECGHACTRTCHLQDDPDHINYICPKPCGRRPVDCTTEGHKCPLPCFETCLPCETKVVRELACGHSVTTRCTNTNPRCEVVCKRKMACGHKCEKKCYEKCGDCTVQVEKVVRLCGHKVRVNCSTPASSKHCDGKCCVILSCGHSCKKRCKDQCSHTDCVELTKLPVALPCGHTGALLPCKMIHTVNFATMSDKEQLLQYCSEPCLQTLNCTHLCSGTCGQCMQGRIHKVCEEDCGNTLICGHSCPVPCRKVCPPCKKKCEFRCIHSKCPKKCGEPCIPCKEPCENRCLHTRCTKRCGELCNRQPCMEPCYIPLPCKHPCVGFCGEPCPPCKVCVPEPFEEFFFTGDETEEDAKWVLLNDCKHVVESRGLEQWLGVVQEEPNQAVEIKLKACPKCRPTEPNRFIATTQRYMNLVKTTFKDIQAVKIKLFGQIEEIRKEREKLLQQVRAISAKEMENFNELGEGIDQLKTLRSTLLTELDYIKNYRRNEISIHKSDLLNFMANVYLDIQKRVVDYWIKLSKNCKEKAFKHINFLISILIQRKEKISEEEMKSFTLELNRLLRMFDLFLIESNKAFANLNDLYPDDHRKLVDLHGKLKAEIYTLTPFTEDKNKIVTSTVEEALKIFNTIVTDEERIMVHKAMSTSWSGYGGERSTNRWYVCGGCKDVYCVADCGQINQVARCGRCKTTIGDHSRIANSEMTRVLQSRIP